MVDIQIPDPIKLKGGEIVYIERYQTIIPLARGKKCPELLVPNTHSGIPDYSNGSICNEFKRRKGTSKYPPECLFCKHWNGPEFSDVIRALKAKEKEISQVEEKNRRPFNRFAEIDFV